MPRDLVGAIAVPLTIDRSCVDAHLVCPRDFPQQLPRPLPDISAQHWKPVLCYPHNMILAVQDRVTSGLRILHTRTVASQSPKGEGFTDPRDENSKYRYLAR